MPAVAKLIQCLRGEVIDGGFLVDGPVLIKDAWTMSQASVNALLARFEDEMSPRVLIDEPPLCGLGEDSKEFLRELMHDLWLRRHAVTRLLADARLALVDAEVAGTGLWAALEAGSPGGPGDQGGAATAAATAFHESLSKLTASISAFPHSILVV